MEITQEFINKTLWQVSCHFRGAVDPTYYKEYILSALFLKYISDIKRYRSSKFIIPKKANFQEIYEDRFSDCLGNRINKALLVIEKANATQLSGVFKGVDFNCELALGKKEERNRRLLALLEGLHRLDIDPNRISTDIIGNSYIYLVSKFASGAGKKAGEFFTPSSVANLLVQLAKPERGDSICDPACGSGSLLIEAAKQTEQAKLFGMEVNNRTCALARMNMIIHDYEARIEWCDTLINPALKIGNRLTQFDRIIANPPFSLKNWGKEKAAADPFQRFWRGIPSKGDYAFISHMIEVAKPKTGRIVVIGPPGLLFHRQAEGKIRRQLIEENVLDAVIGLPKGLFPTTGIPVIILVFDLSREKGGKRANRKDILFIDASRDSDKEKNRCILTNHQAGKIVTTYEHRKSIKNYAYLAPMQEVYDNDCNLNLPLYIDFSEPEKPIDIKQLQAKLHQVESNLSKKKSQMKRYLLEVT